MINQLLQVVAPILVVIAVGYIWGKSGRRYDLEFVTSIAMNLGSPCLAFSTLTNIKMSHALMGRVSLATVSAIMIFAITGYLILRCSGLSIDAFLAPIMFPNIGNMGLPVCLFAYGNEGLALAIVVFAVILIGQFTVAIFLYSGTFASSAIFKNPVIISIIISFALLITGVSPPQWIVKSTKLIGDITIPVMLITLGVSLSNMRVLNTSRAILLSIARTGLGFLVGLLISWLFGLTGIARGVFILQCSMPVAVFNYLLAEQYGKKPKDVAELIIISTLLSILVLPVILQYLKG
jgi:malate permease and related proteins